MAPAARLKAAPKLSVSSLSTTRHTQHAAYTGPGILGKKGLNLSSALSATY